MISIKVDFNADAFERSIVDQMKAHVESTLRRAGVRGLRVTIKKERGELKLNLSGDDDEIEKAKKALDIR